MSVRLKIGFVTDKELDDIFVTIFIDFGKPVFDILERLPVGDIINENNSVSTLVVGGSNGFESLLPGGVPNLKFDGVSSSFESSDLEIDSDGGQETK